MFFPRLRRQAKWVFVFLALVFGFGFVVFGVGTGSTGISEAFDGGLPFVGGTNTGTPSVGDAREKVRENPKDPAAIRQLVTALQTEGRTDEAIPYLERLVKLRPRDTDALGQLAALHLTKAARIRGEAQALQIDAQLADAGTVFRPPPDSRLGQALPPDPFTQTVTAQLNERLNTMFLSMQDAYSSAERTYKQLAAVRPRDPSIQLQLANAAQFAGHFDPAIAAYRRFLTLAPDDPTAPAVREQIRSLIQAKAQSPPLGGG